MHFAVNHDAFYTIALRTTPHHVNLSIQSSIYSLFNSRIQNPCTTRDAQTLHVHPTLALPGPSVPPCLAAGLLCPAWSGLPSILPWQLPVALAGPGVCKLCLVKGRAQLGVRVGRQACTCHFSSGHMLA